MREYSYH